MKDEKMTQAFGEIGRKKGLPPLKKAAIGKMDPMLDIYSREGIFGTRPGMVKGERGEEVPIEKVVAFEEKKREDGKEQERIELEKANAKERVEAIVKKIKEKKKHLYNTKDDIDMVLFTGIAVPVCAAMAYGFYRLYDFCNRAPWILNLDMSAHEMASMIASGAGVFIGGLGGIITGLFGGACALFFPLLLLEGKGKMWVNFKENKSVKKEITELKKELAGLEKEGIEGAKEALMEIG
jgi:hypothetical protein